MSSELAIEIKNLSKCYKIYNNHSDRLLQMLSLSRKRYYREFWALKDLSFKIKKGETVGIIGHNGSGKSTLLQLICGTLNQTAGTITTNGRIAALLELGSGFNPEFTGRENVYMNASLLGLTKQQINQRFDRIIGFSEIGNFIEQPVKTYSSGMILRLAFAVIAHIDADILIIDEALAVGDAFFTQKCIRFLRDFMKSGTVIFVSHDTQSIKNLCNRVLWLDKGNLIQQGIPKNICNLYLETLYGVKQNNINIHKLKITTGKTTTIKDQRLNFINHSNLRNDLQVFKFNQDTNFSAKGSAEIYDVTLLDETETPLAWIVGGEKVILRIKVQAYQDLNLPIIGFFIQDRLGQNLFGDNTFLSYQEDSIICPEEQTLQADFVFNMPLLPHGDYSITVSIATGTQEIHEQHHWLHDAILFKSQASSVTTGLIGIPMEKIKLSIVDKTCSYIT